MYLGLKGTASRAFVQELWFEGVPAGEVWFEGVRLYPDDRTLVRDLVLSGGRDAYWVHAMDAVSKGAEGTLLVLTVGDRQFHLGVGDGTLPVLRWVQGAWRAEAEYGLLLHEVLHAEVTVDAVVHERRIVLPVGPMSGGEDVTLRVLPVIEGTRTEWTQWGNKRHAHGHYWQSFTSPSTGVKFFEKENYKSGRTPKVGHFDVSAGPEEDEESIMRIWFYMTKHTGGAKEHAIVYPAFERRWRMRVEGCTLQRIDD